MSSDIDFNPENLNQFFPVESQLIYVERLRKRNKMTSYRAKCFVRLWGYLWIKEQYQLGRRIEKPINKLEILRGSVSCSCREAAIIFYSDVEEREKPESAARMMLNLLAKLGVITKERDGHILSFTITPLPEILDLHAKKPRIEISQLEIHDVNHVASLLAANYKQMHLISKKEASDVEERLIKLLTRWSEQYSRGMRILRRCDIDKVVGFYLFYPVHSESETNFRDTPSKGLHLSMLIQEVDPFRLALPGDECSSVFVRSWIIDSDFRNEMQTLFLKDAQKTLKKMRRDFPSLCNLYTLIIHPSYEPLLHYLGFHRMVNESEESVYWTYLALARFLKRKIPEQLPFRSVNPNLMQ